MERFAVAFIFSDKKLHSSKEASNRLASLKGGFFRYPKYFGARKFGLWGYSARPLLGRTFRSANGQKRETAILGRKKLLYPSKESACAFCLPPLRARTTTSRNHWRGRSQRDLSAKKESQRAHVLLIHRFAGAIFWFSKYLHRAPQNTLGGKALAPILIPTPIHANEQIVLQENFDSTPAINFKYKLGLWVIVPENARNNVLDINSMDTALEYPVVEFGESKWKNFSFKTRINIVDYSASNDAPLASIKFRGKYKIAFTPYWKGIDLVLDPPWKIISGRTIEIQKNKWYRVRIEVEGSTVNVFLDDKLVISDVIADKIFGSFGFSTWPEAHVQFDDITIASTDE